MRSTTARTLLSNYRSQQPGLERAIVLSKYRYQGCEKAVDNRLNRIDLSTDSHLSTAIGTKLSPGDEMSTDLQNTSITDSMAIPVCIVLAEADFAETARIRSHIAAEFQAGIAIASNYQQLLETIERESPQIVILGRIDNFNYFEICEECHSRQAELPIVMLSKQKIISGSFCELLKSYGLTDIITEDYSKLNKLLRQLKPRPAAQKPPQPPQPTVEAKAPIPTGAVLLAALMEIVAASNNYFGTLAQGNYWRKAHERVVRPFPLLQHWSADHFGKIHCDEQTLARSLDLEDLEALRMWVQHFIEECERIIVDFRLILKNAELSALAESLLPGK